MGITKEHERLFKSAAQPKVLAGKHGRYGTVSEMLDIGNLAPRLPAAKDGEKLRDVLNHDLTQNIFSIKTPYDLGEASDTAHQTFSKVNAPDFAAVARKSEEIVATRVRKGDYDFDFETVPAHPSSRETFLDAFKNVRFAILNESMTLDAKGTFNDCYKSFTSAEWFDFGKVHADDIAAASMDARELFKAGLLHAPYEVCVFRARLVHSGTEIEVGMLIDTRDDSTMIMQFRSNGLRNEYISLIAGVYLKDGTIKGVGSKDKQQADFSLMLFYEYLGLWTILNARGVGKIVEEPSEKLNRARARNNKHPLKRVVRVDSARYVTALHETQRIERAGGSTAQGGTGRSPKMHLRRGHMRTYVHDRYKGLPTDQRVKWIRPMIISGTGDIDKNRDAYVVKVK